MSKWKHLGEKLGRSAKVEPQLLEITRGSSIFARRQAPEQDTNDYLSVIVENNVTIQGRELLFTPVAASVSSYFLENDRDCYTIKSLLENGQHWELYRSYEDFYDLQVALLKNFPHEAGQGRTLPYTPGPVKYVTHAISKGRRESLDNYIKGLLNLSPLITHCHPVQDFFTPRQSDLQSRFTNVLVGKNEVPGSTRQKEKIMTCLTDEKALSSSPFTRITLKSSSQSDGTWSPEPQQNISLEHGEVSATKSRTEWMRAATLPLAMFNVGPGFVLKSPGCMGSSEAC